MVLRLYPVTIDDVKRWVDQIRAEGMELVEAAPEDVRSEFGFGMVHGFLKAANRFGTLCEEHLADMEQKEEQFERDFGSGDAAPERHYPRQPGRRPDAPAGRGRPSDH